ncbi:hypothetical protein HX776_23565 [Pseudomonas agarici]|uniref:hypothetical protein n=1 Tax=Pseudomonas agarici TaxID=46677 RepID=UPI0003700F76|nr:hypothetical protein [Pseudomonas agarici]NWC11769.1 hypothetical protein [Pseudomonas agarici]SEL91897.1 hypothetical protein SAMN05216604_1601 [Pseudomonas agarici]
MSNNKMISVPRELLNRVATEANHMLGFTSASNYDECRNAVDELRALLDAPESSVCAKSQVEPAAQAQAQGEPVAWRYKSHAVGPWYLSSSEHNARTFQGNGQGGEVQPLYAEQPAPLAVSQGEPVSDLIQLDRSYRNGIMAGFQFGITGDEKGYAACIQRYNAGIHEAKSQQPAPVSVVLPERREVVGIGGHAYYSPIGWNACLDEVARLNPSL